MISTLNLTNNIRLPSLELFLKYYIRYSEINNRNMGERDDKDDSLSVRVSEKGGLV